MTAPGHFDTAMESPRFPAFDATIAPGGYAWWYIDAMSDDSQHGLTLIAFIGSVFSPYYASARERGDADPLDHCALNVALYGPRAKRWALTERGRNSVHRSAASLAIGPSALRWDGDTLSIDINEITVPLPSRIRGVVRLRPMFVTDRQLVLDSRGRHRWWPISPRASVQAEFSRPALRWSGSGYLDANSGDAPLENAFTRWDWSHANLGEGAAVLYDLLECNGSSRSLAMRFDRSGNTEQFTPPPKVQLPGTGWRVNRKTRADGKVSVLRTFEDTPFYNRSLLASQLCGEPVISMHESLSLHRFATDWVKVLLPFRMPRSHRKFAAPHQG